MQYLPSTNLPTTRRPLLYFLFSNLDSSTSMMYHSIFKYVFSHALSKCLVECRGISQYSYSWREFLQHPQNSLCYRTSRGDGGISRRRCSCFVGYFQLEQCGSVVLQCRSSSIHQCSLKRNKVSTPCRHGDAARWSQN